METLTETLEADAVPKVVRPPCVTLFNSELISTLRTVNEDLLKAGIITPDQHAENERKISLCRH